MVGPGADSDHLDRLTNLADGYMDSVLPLRNQTGADLVALLCGAQRLLGRAVLQGLTRRLAGVQIKHHTTTTLSAGSI